MGPSDSRIREERGTIVQKLASMEKISGEGVWKERISVKRKFYMTSEFAREGRPFLAMQWGIQGERGNNPYHREATVTAWQVYAKSL